MKRAAILLPALLLLALASGVIALAYGSAYTDFASVWRALTGREQGLAYDVVMQLRLPRAINAFTTGAMLALAGVLMQVLLRNPLADPYVLGISGGAAVAALGGILLGVAGVWLNGAAFAGALASMFLVFGLARGAGAWSSSRLLLTGVIVAAGWGALISLLLALSPDAKLRGMLFWLMGDLGNGESTLPGMIGLALGLVLSLPAARALNVMVRGEMTARSLGVPVTGLRLHLYLVASLLTAVAVMAAGSIGFIGLVAPHILRLAAGNDHRILLPGSALFGGSLLVLADTAARTVIAPQQLPVGVVTALLGVPLFLYLLTRSHRG
ncbi:MAG: iron ABC transporter permease [Hydrogenophilales bacterium]|nr:iron ABC transporter permease [Hydrogenophilales bacterium]